MKYALNVLNKELKDRKFHLRLYKAALKTEFRDDYKHSVIVIEKHIIDIEQAI